MAELNFATSDADAAERATKYRNTDPFPSIPLSHLSSAEIDDYVRVTGLMYPFDTRGPLIVFKSDEQHLAVVAWNVAQTVAISGSHGNGDRSDLPRFKIAISRLFGPLRI